MKRLIEELLARPLVVNLVTLIIISLGIISFTSMNREAFPSVNFDFVQITTIYPGASPSEIESLITDRIEDEIENINNIDEIKSASIEGRSSISVKIEADASEMDKNETIEEIHRAVRRTRGLPTDLLSDPMVFEIKSDRLPAIEVALTSNQLSDIELFDHAKRLQNQIETIDDVSSVEYRGEREIEFKIEVDPRKLTEYHIGLNQIIAVLQTQNINMPGGVINSPNGEFLVRAVGRADSKEKLADTVLRSTGSGQSVRLSDLATIVREQESPQLIYTANGEKANILRVLKSSDGDIIKVTDQTRKIVDDYVQRYPELKAAYVNDVSVFVRNRLGVLSNNGIFGIIFVSIILILFSLASRVFGCSSW